MRKFDISVSNKKLIISAAEDSFGTVTKTNTDTYVINEPEHDLLEEVLIKINEEKEELCLQIESICVDDALENGLVAEVPHIVKIKNTFLKFVTGKTVEKRKKEWRQEVIPEDEKAYLRV